ncbi:MAG: pyridoxal 5'-phosphate synthase glutaminase subunit PdxT [Candidatus Diapherotrites archaeon]
MKTIGVLALQGDFFEHTQILESMKINSIEVRNKTDLKKCSALIIPGGESTTIGKLLAISGLDKEIKKRAKKGMPVYGTCAGAIVLAKKVLNEKEFKPLGLIDVEIKRNAYGRQVDSFEAEVNIEGIGKLNGVFIRAPKIIKKGKKVETLASFEGNPVLVKQGNVLIGTFHLETEKETAMHKLLVQMI